MGIRIFQNNRFMIPPRLYFRHAYQRKQLAPKPREHWECDKQPSQLDKQHLRDVFDPRVLQAVDYVLGKLELSATSPTKEPSQTYCSRHLGRICPGNIVVQPLPPRNPASGRVTDGDQALKDL